MIVATFGELADQANGLLWAAGRCPPPTVREIDTVVAGMRRLVITLGRYLDDRAPVHMPTAAKIAAVSARERALIDAQTAIHSAGTSLSDRCKPADPPALPGSLAGQLGQAAAVLAAGRDLLQIHLSTGPDGQWQSRSPWGPVVRSPAVTAAVAGQVARWARRAAQIAARQIPYCPPSSAARASWQTAAQWLWLAHSTLQTVGIGEPDGTAGYRLLRAIPTTQLPRRNPPSSDEPPSALRTGIMLSADRLRAAVFATRRDALAPVAADTCRWTALAAAITAQASQHLLATLTRSELASTPHLAAATAALEQAGTAWRQLALDWLPIATTLRGHTSPLTPELTDLTLRLGRLASNNPTWTPTSPPARPNTTPASTPGDIAATVATVHHATDALATVAAADLAAVTTLSQTRQLYVLTRAMPDGYDIPRRYATALPRHIRPLLNAYQHVLATTNQATSELATMALALDAPSAPLALARAACAPSPGHRDDAGLSAPTQLPSSARISARSSEAVPARAVVPSPSDQVHTAHPHAPARSRRARQPAISRPAAPVGQHAARLAAQDTPHAPRADKRAVSSPPRQPEPSARPGASSRPGRAPRV